MYQYHSCNKIVEIFYNYLYNLNLLIGLMIAHFRIKCHIYFTVSTCFAITTSSPVTAPTEDLAVSVNNVFFLMSARSHNSFIGFNLIEIT